MNEAEEEVGLLMAGELGDEVSWLISLSPTAIKLFGNWN